jgi:hypothetical protein
MARQLTLIDYDFLSRITAKEWLAHNDWATKSKRQEAEPNSKPAAPNLVAMINHFNQVHLFFVFFSIIVIIKKIIAGEQMGCHGDCELRENQAQDPSHQEIHRSGSGIFFLLLL